MISTTWYAYIGCTINVVIARVCKWRRHGYVGQPSLRNLHPYLYFIHLAVGVSCVLICVECFASFIVLCMGLYCGKYFTSSLHFYNPQDVIKKPLCVCRFLFFVLLLFLCWFWRWNLLAVLVVNQHNEEIILQWSSDAQEEL